MLRKIILIIVLIVCSFSILQTAKAQDRKFGIGGIIGDPDGITAKAWVSESIAISGAFAVDLGENYKWVSIQADVLKQNTLATWEEASLQSHFGGGVRFTSSDYSPDEFIALRVPVGIDVNAIDTPVEVFMEVVPSVDVDPNFYFYFSGAMGFRYYFGSE